MGQRRSVVKISPEYEILDEYSWCGEAAITEDVSRTFVVDRVYPNRREHLSNEFRKGFSFRYADDPEFLNKRIVSSKVNLNAKDFIMDHVEERELLILMMEECSEMIQACSKRIRATTEGNPTPVKAKEALAMMNEEAGDMLIILEMLGYVPDGTTADNPKLRRWAQRLGYELRLEEKK